MGKVTATMVHPRPPGPMGAEVARRLARNFRKRKRATIDPDRGSRKNRSVVAREKKLQSRGGKSRARGRQQRSLPKARTRKHGSQAGSEKAARMKSQPLRESRSKREKAAGV